ncbi:MAG: cytochrome-ba3 oxidase subunit [Halobacteriaceae archaeon]
MASARLWVFAATALLAVLPVVAFATLRPSLAGAVAALNVALVAGCLYVMFGETEADASEAGRAA